MYDFMIEITYINKICENLVVKNACNASRRMIFNGILPLFKKS